MKIKYKKGTFSRGFCISNNGECFASFGLINYPFVRTDVETNFREKLFHIGYVSDRLYILRFVFFAIQFDLWRIDRFDKYGDFLSIIHEIFRVIQIGNSNA